MYLLKHKSQMIQVSLSVVTKFIKESSLFQCKIKYIICDCLVMSVSVKKIKITLGDVTAKHSNSCQTIIGIDKEQDIVELRNNNNNYNQDDTESKGLKLHIENYVNERLKWLKNIWNITQKVQILNRKEKLSEIFVVDKKYQL